MRRLPRTLLCVAVVLMGACVLGPVSPASAAGCKNQYLMPKKSNVNAVEKAMRCLLNRERTRRGMKRLARRSTLRRAATRHSRSMVRRHYFSHNGPDGSLSYRIKRAGYRGRAYAENITYGNGRYATPRNLVRRWMKSSAHRHNILGGVYDHMGIGLWLGTPYGRGGATVTMTMGGR